MADTYSISEFERKHKRKAYEKEVFFSLDSKAYPATTRNISLGGALIEHVDTYNLNKGQTITINIPFSSSKKSIKRKARIMWILNKQFGIEFI